MRAGRDRVNVCGAVEEQAVFWSDSSAPGALYGGGAAVESGYLRLRGSDGRRRVVETVPAAEFAAVATGGDAEPIAGFPSLRLDLHSGRSLVVAAALGSAALAELVDAVLSFFPMP